MHKRQTAALWTSSAICGGLPFPPAGRPDNGNYLESGEIRGNMLTRLYSHFVQFMGVSCNGI